MPRPPQRAETAPARELVSAAGGSGAGTAERRFDRLRSSPGRSPLGVSPGKARGAPTWGLPPAGPRHRRSPSDPSYLVPMEGSRRSGLASAASLAPGTRDKMGAVSGSSERRAGRLRSPAPPTAAALVAAEEGEDRLRRRQSLLSGSSTGGGLAQASAAADGQKPDTRKTLNPFPAAWTAEGCGGMPCTALRPIYRSPCVMRKGVPVYLCIHANRGPSGSRPIYRSACVVTLQTAVKNASGQARPVPPPSPLACTEIEFRVKRLGSRSR